MVKTDPPRRFLVFGGSGFLGARLLSALDDGERELVSVSRSPGARPREPRETVRDVVGDLTQAGTAETLIGRSVDAEALVATGLKPSVGPLDTSSPAPDPGPMTPLGPPLQFLLLTFGGWVNRHQQDAIDYLIEENRILREHLPKASPD